MKPLTIKRISNHIWRVLREAHITLELVDARYPHKTRNRWIEYKAGWGRLIIVVNKIDLISKQEQNEIRDKLRKEKIPFVLTSAKKGIGKNQIFKIIDKVINKNKKMRDQDKIKIGITGYPDVGKSSLINLLTGKRKVKVEARPGSTRGKQYIRLNDRLLLIDTPGIFPRGQNLDELTLQAAFDVERLDDPITTAEKLIKRLISKDKKQALEKKYDLKIKSNKPYEILEELADRRNMLIKGGEYNIEGISKILLRDWQKGKIK